ncbi:AbrB/MazE/SpoVT family DNA-binding domain-containing protein [Brevibacterium album]|uniref:AbrB/MazE/SpoVT family DNA-binding domain-containing protein n=1 Tax=Brevibacterium album TaxID=417948 RepID=UPI00040C7508|nr:AbrB/MazE/SpoVT family DNA-binding domain-containing protein [Brevibacterium album]
MSEATVTSKGQITLPKELRDELHLTTGSKVAFIRAGEGLYRLIPRTRSIRDLIGILHDPERAPMTIEEMNEAIADGWAASGAQGVERQERE